MTATFESTILEHRMMVAPPIYKFPGLSTIDGVSYGGWGWNKMSELDDVVTSWFKSQGYKGNNGVFSPEYRTFSPALLSKETRKSVWFSWCEGIDPSEVSISVQPNFDACPFDDSHLYVSSGWGVAIVNLAKLGIIRFQGLRVPEVVRWNGDIVPFGR